MLEVLPLTPERWQDFADLCAQMGPNRSCYCMWWREEPGQSRAHTRARAQALVTGACRPPGLLGYVDHVPVAWVAVAPRAEYPRLQANRNTAPADGEEGVWAVPCFFVLPQLRGQGIARTMLREAVRFAWAQGAQAVDGVPVDPAAKQRSSSASYTGTLPMFLAAGFVEKARRHPQGRVVVQRRSPL